MRVLLLPLMIFCFASRALAQDFAGAMPAMGDGPLTFIEQGVIRRGPALAVESCVVRWLGLEDLATRSIAIGGRWRRVSAATGVSATGSDEGWRAVGVATGYASTNAGAALRAVARREAAVDAIETVLGRGEGLEAGVGAWVQTGEGLYLWMSHPQILVRGASPPLRRGLETGLRYETEGLSMWVARRSAAGREARHRVGLGLEFGDVATIWAEARDDPLRAGYGVEARLELITFAISIESHPVLGETARLSLALSTGDSP
jgi:hypothetical protein